MADIAGDLGYVKMLPIPSEQRLDVFVCPGLSDEALARWVSQAGASFFHTDDVVEPASFCGMVLFVLGPCGYLDGKTSELLQPFYARAEGEANCFQWDPIERSFVRRGPEWFALRRR
jgi:hypothetical protein